MQVLWPDHLQLRARFVVALLCRHPVGVLESAAGGVLVLSKSSTIRITSSTLAVSCQL